MMGRFSFGIYNNWALTLLWELAVDKVALGDLTATENSWCSKTCLRSNGHSQQTAPKGVEMTLEELEGLLADRVLISKRAVQRQRLRVQIWLIGALGSM
jgi:hypothetical protein